MDAACFDFLFYQQAQSPMLLLKVQLDRFARSTKQVTGRVSASLACRIEQSPSNHLPAFAAGNTPGRQWDYSRQVC